MAHNEDAADTGDDFEDYFIGNTQSETSSPTVTTPSQDPSHSNASVPEGNSLISKPLPGKPKKLNYREKICSELEKRSKEREEIIKNLLQPEDEPDEIDLFFKSIAKTVKSFPLHLKQRAKLETLTLISKIEMDMWSTRPSSSTCTPTNFSCTPSPAPSGSSVGAHSQVFAPVTVDPMENQSLYFAIPNGNIYDQQREDNHQLPC